MNQVNVIRVPVTGDRTIYARRKDLRQNSATSGKFHPPGIMNNVNVMRLVKGHFLVVTEEPPPCK